MASVRLHDATLQAIVDRGELSELSIAELQTVDAMYHNKQKAVTRLRAKVEAYELALERPISVTVNQPSPLTLTPSTCPNPLGPGVTYC